MFDVGLAAFGDLDPVPKTMTIDVVAPQDPNLDGVVNGLDISYVASRWGQTLPDGRVANGLVMAAIAAHWLETSPPSGHIDEEVLSMVAADRPPGSGTAPAAVYAEQHLQPIYPPRVVRWV